MKKARRRRIPVEVHKGIVIREVRPGYWMIDTMRRGKRERACFKDLTTAKTRAEQLATLIANEGLAALALTGAQRRDAAAAFKALTGRGVTLEAAARFWLHHHPAADAVTVEALADRFMSDLRARNCRDTTMAEREQKFRRLIRDMGMRPAVTVGESDLVGWMDGKGLKGQTRDGYRRAFHALFNFALARRIVPANPAALIPKVLDDQKTPRFFTTAETERIMNAAAEHQPRIVPYLALQFFGGLRPGEAAAMDWSAIRIKGRLLTVDAATSKRRRRRLVKMSDTLAAWLKPYEAEAGRVGRDTKEQAAYALRSVCRKAGVQWIQDGPRHTYATMRAAVEKDLNKIAVDMGNSAGVILDHYRGLATAREAREFWRLRPIWTATARRETKQRPAVIVQIA